jgi:hypothetical protein
MQEVPALGWSSCGVTTLVLSRDRHLTANGSFIAEMMAEPCALVRDQWLGASHSGEFETRAETWGYTGPARACEWPQSGVVNSK